SARRTSPATASAATASGWRCVPVRGLRKGLLFSGFPLRRAAAPVCHKRGNGIMPRTAKKTRVQADIDRMVERIVQKFHPEQVILFGSHARGEAGPDSDVDLLVVMDFEGTALDAAVEVRQALHHILVPKDVIVTRPEEFGWRKDVVGTI